MSSLALLRQKETTETAAAPDAAFKATAVEAAAALQAQEKATEAAASEAAMSLKALLLIEGRQSEASTVTMNALAAVKQEGTVEVLRHTVSAWAKA